MKRLKRKPFDVKDQAERKSMSRFLVEEGEGELVVDLDAGKEIAELLTKFQGVIGEYTILSAQEEAVLTHELR